MIYRRSLHMYNSNSIDLTEPKLKSKIILNELSGYELLGLWRLSAISRGFITGLKVWPTASLRMLERTFSMAFSAQKDTSGSLKMHKERLHSTSFKEENEIAEPSHHFHQLVVSLHRPQLGGIRHVPRRVISRLSIANCVAERYSRFFHVFAHTLQ